MASFRNGSSASEQGRSVPQGVPGRGGRSLSGTRWPGWHQPKSKSALLCSAGRAAADRLAVDYSGEQTSLRLQAGAVSLLLGMWQTTLARADAAAAVAGNWELGLWHADADCDYLELSCQVAAGLRVDRHFLLSRTEQFAVLADAVQGPPGMALQYRSQIPHGAGLACQTVAGSTELRLRRGRSAVARPAGRRVRTLGNGLWLVQSVERRRHVGRNSPAFGLTFLFGNGGVASGGLNPRRGQLFLPVVNSK